MIEQLNFLVSLAFCRGNNAPWYISPLSELVGISERMRNTYLDSNEVGAFHELTTIQMWWNLGSIKDSKTALLQYEHCFCTIH